MAALTYLTVLLLPLPAGRGTEGAGTRSHATLPPIHGEQRGRAIALAQMWVFVSHADADA